VNARQPAAQDPEQLSAGTPFYTDRGGHAGQIDRLLGAGGQGAVYLARLNGAEFAVKWYNASYAAVDTNLRPRLSRAIERGAPDGTFLWPIDLVHIPGRSSFGYMMRLRDTDHVGMRDLIARPPQRVTPPLAVRAAICCNIANSFLELHSSGFCYQDINFGNVFFRPSDGDILICDNDNVDIDGAQASVFGTRKFMAPEIVRRETMPNTKSDLFSMAVLFFYVLHAWHPLDGRREAAVPIMDSAAEIQLYGTQPLFLFDPVDDSNGVLAGMHEPIAARWNALPQAVRALFIRSFCVGLRDPGSRVQEAEWRAAFSSLQLAGFACPRCGWEHAASFAPQARACVACNAEMAMPPVLLVGRQPICLAAGCRIPLHVLQPGRAARFGAIGAVVEAHPTRTDVLGLRNQSGDIWRLTLRDATEVAVHPGSAMRLIDGARIDFGGARGAVSMPEAVPA
jgi:DNA-binding helix-hairpin-helix protein with protein kinase domain